MKYVYLSAKVQSRLQELKKSGKAGSQLARKATRIIESLTSGVVRHHRDAIGSYTKYGEKRIRNCRKYDLGCGYRLITLQRGSKVFIPFLGPHDDCQRWLETNSRMKAATVGKGTLFRVPPSSQPCPSPENHDLTEIAEEDEDEISLKLSDQDLRRVFWGLIDGGRKQPCKGSE